MNKNDIVLKTIEYVKKASTYNDFGHDFLHVERVLNLSNRIAKTLKQCDTFIVQMVALLHDVEDDKLESKNHFSVKEFLNEMKLNEEVINKIIECINYISYTHNPFKNDKIPLEAKIVQDADRIDAIGAVGVARTFAFSASRKIPFYDNKENKHSTLKHFEEKLFKLYDLLNTDEAKKIAIKRHKFMKQYYNQFLDEINN